MLTAVCLHINWKAHAACDLNIFVKCEGILKVTGSHIRGLSNSSNCNDLECP